MIGATCFSGIGAPEQASPWVGWEWCAEVDPFAAAVHGHQFGTPNLGDVLADDFFVRAAPVDLLVGGPPCQAFSVAGLRHSLADPRGNLSLRWVQIIHAIKPVWCVTENVPGWLSTKDNAFGCFLAALVGADAPLVPPSECGGRWTDSGMVVGPIRDAAWRILDAQYFGVPQRRRRVFVVSRRAGNGQHSAAVLFEPQSLRGDPPPRRETGQDAAGGAGDGSAFSVRPTSHDASWRGDGADNLIPAIADPISCSENRTYTHEGTTFRGHNLIAFGGNNTAGPVDVATACNAHGGPHGRLDFESETFVTQPYNIIGNAQKSRNHAYPTEISGCLQHKGLAASGNEAGTLITHNSHDLEYRDDGIANAILTPNGGRAGIGVGAVAFHENQRAETTLNDTAGSLKVGGGKPGQGYPAVLAAYGISSDAIDRSGEGDGSAAERAGLGVIFDGAPAIRSRPNNSVATGMSVRRLTPRECERLQGFPDGFTAITYRGKPAADGRRYRALGNSMAVPVIGWVLGRIREVAA